MLIMSSLLWVKLALRSIAETMNKGLFSRVEIERVLYSLPKDLANQYSFILDRIPNRRLSEAMNILEWISFTFRPLSCQEFVEAVEPPGLGSGIELSPTNAHRRAGQVVDLVFGLVKVRNDQVLLVHDTVRDFLMFGQHLMTLHPLHAHQQILSTCFEALLEEPDVKRPAFFNYAAEFWGRHFQEVGRLAGGNSPPSFLDALAKLFDDNHPEFFLRWLRRYDPLNPKAGSQPEKRLEDFPSQHVYMNFIRANL